MTFIHVLISLFINIYFFSHNLIHTCAGVMLSGEDNNFDIYLKNHCKHKQFQVKYIYKFKL